MATVRSRMARRGRTGRKALTAKHPRRRVQVRTHHHRRYAGVKGGKGAPSTHRRLAGVTGTKTRASKTGRRRTFKGRSARGHAIARVLKGRHGHRIFKGRKKSLHKRVMRKGLHRKFKGRQYHGRHVKPGLHRRFLGRKPSTHPRRISPPKPKTPPMSSASYLSMF